MAVENAVGNPVDPVPAVADFAVRHIGEIGPERSADPAEHLFWRIELNAANLCWHSLPRFGLRWPSGAVSRAATPRYLS